MAYADSKRRTRATRALSAMALVAMTSGAAWAQTPESPPSDAAPAARLGSVDAVKLAPVVVTATRVPVDALLVPAAIDVIDSAALHRAQPSIDLAETLRRVPGVVARDRQNQAQDLQISIRGFGARAAFGVRGIRLYSDGIPATMPDGQGQVSHFALETAERIEVLRGPFSALYGNASGGVISVFNADAKDPPTAGLDYVAGSDGLQRTSVSWQTRLGELRGGSFVGNAARVQGDGYRRHSQWRRDGAQAVLKGDSGSAGRYVLLFNSLELAADDPQGLSAAQVVDDRRAASQGALTFDTRKTVAQRQIGGRWEQSFGLSHQVTATAHSGSRATTQMLSVPVVVQRRNPTHGGGAIDLARDYAGVDLRWQWSSTLLEQPFAVTAGWEYQVSDERRRGYENFVGNRLGVRGRLRRDQDDRVTGRDLYVQTEWSPSARWRVNAGARRSAVEFSSRDHYITADNPDDSGSMAFARVSPVAGVLFRATDWLSFYANAGGGFETPTLAELAYRNDALSGFNDRLQPASSRNLELGLRARQGERAYSAAVFQSRTRDELVVVSNEGGRSTYGNAGLSRRQGIELAWSAPLATRWHLAAAYTWLDARYLDDVPACDGPSCSDERLLIQGGRRIPGLARQWAWSELRFSPLASTDVMLEGQFTDRIQVDDANSATAPAAARFDLAAEHRLRAGGLQWRGFARINNLLDRDIIGSVIVNDANGRFYEPAPGRHWQLGVSAQRSF